MKTSAPTTFAFLVCVAIVVALFYVDGAVAKKKEAVSTSIDYGSSKSKGKSNSKKKDATSSDSFDLGINGNSKESSSDYSQDADGHIDEDPDAIKEKNGYGGSSGRTFGAAGKGDVVEAQYVVVLTNRTGFGKARKELRELVEANGGTMLKHFDASFPGFAVETSNETLIDFLEKHPLVLSVEENVRFSISEFMQTSAPNHLDRLDERLQSAVDNLYIYNTTGANIKVFIVDTGVKYTHSEFEGRAQLAYDHFSTVPIGDANGHGTHVASTVAGKTYGVAKQALIYSVRVLDENGVGDTVSVMSGLDYIRQNHAPPGVINLSIAGKTPGQSLALDNRLQDLAAVGWVISIAAGNEGRPACIFDKNAVSRVAPIAVLGSAQKVDGQSLNEVSDFSNFGHCVSAHAIGSPVTGAYYFTNNALATLQGTSMVAPQFSGLAARYLQYISAAKPPEVVQALLTVSSSGVLPPERLHSDDRIAGFSSPDRFLYGNFENFVDTNRSDVMDYELSHPCFDLANGVITGAPNNGLSAETIANFLGIPYSASLSFPSFCSVYTGNTDVDESLYFPSEDGFSGRDPGYHWGLLWGDTFMHQGDLDLGLQMYNPSTTNWQMVANSVSFTDSEKVFRPLNGGSVAETTTYRWRVNAAEAGGGDFTLVHQRPITVNREINVCSFYADPVGAVAENYMADLTLSPEINTYCWDYVGTGKATTIETHTAGDSLSCPGDTVLDLWYCTGSSCNASDSTTNSLLLSNDDSGPGFCSKLTLQSFLQPAGQQFKVCVRRFSADHVVHDLQVSIYSPGNEICPTPSATPSSSRSPSLSRTATSSMTSTATTSATRSAAVTPSSTPTPTPVMNDNSCPESETLLAIGELPSWAYETPFLHPYLMHFNYEPTGADLSNQSVVLMEMDNVCSVWTTVQSSEAEQLVYVHYEHRGISVTSKPIELYDGETVHITVSFDGEYARVHLDGEFSAISSSAVDAEAERQLEKSGTGFPSVILVGGGLAANASDPAHEVETVAIGNRNLYVHSRIEGRISDIALWSKVITDRRLRHIFDGSEDIYESAAVTVEHLDWALCRPTASYECHTEYLTGTRMEQAVPLGNPVVFGSNRPWSFELWAQRNSMGTVLWQRHVLSIRLLPMGIVEVHRHTKHVSERVVSGSYLNVLNAHSGSNGVWVHLTFEYTGKLVNIYAFDTLIGSGVSGPLLVADDGDGESGELFFAGVDTSLDADDYEAVLRSGEKPLHGAVRELRLWARSPEDDELGFSQSTAYSLARHTQRHFLRSLPLHVGEATALAWIRCGDDTVPSPGAPPQPTPSSFPTPLTTPSASPSPVVWHDLILQVCVEDGDTSVSGLETPPLQVGYLGRSYVQSYRLQDWTLEAQVEKTSSSPSGVVLAQYQVTHAPLYYMSISDGKLRCNFVTHSGVPRLVSSSSNVFASGDVAHIACTWNGTHLSAYIDGAVSGTMEIPYVTDISPNTVRPAPISIGGRFASSTPSIPSAADMELRNPVWDVSLSAMRVLYVRIWDNVRSEAELQAHASTAVIGPSSPSTVNAYSLSLRTGNVVEPVSNFDSETNTTTLSRCEGLRGIQSRPLGERLVNSVPRVVSPSPLLLGLDEPVTVEFWIGPQTADGTIVWRPVDTATGVTLFSIAVQERKIIFERRSEAYAGSASVTTSHSLPASQWTHVAVVYCPADSLMKMYWNGALEFGTPVGGGDLEAEDNNPTTPLVIGGKLQAGSSTEVDPSSILMNSIRELRVWSEVRDAGELGVWMDVPFTSLGSLPSGLRLYICGDDCDTTVN